MTIGLDERLVESTVATLELFGVYLGTRLGLYQALAEQGPLTASRLAETADIHPRYAREWLEQQAVAGFVTVDDARRPTGERRYALPAEHRGVLVDADHLAHVAPLADAVVGIASVLPEVVQAYRTGGGVPYRHYGADFRRGQGGINRPVFTSELTGSWLPAMPDLNAALMQPGARIADIGCGQGFAAIALAKAFPQAEVIGLDADSASIEEAREFARQAAVPVGFVAGDAADLARHGPFDAVFLLETLHDLARPVEVLQSCRNALRADGSVVVADERVQPQFSAPGDLLERMMYGWSVSHCLPSQMVEQPSAAIGTVIRPAQVVDLATHAGFGSAEVTDIDGGFFRIYRLRDSAA